MSLLVMTLMLELVLLYTSLLAPHHQPSLASRQATHYNHQVKVVTARVTITLSQAKRERGMRGDPVQAERDRNQRLSLKESVIAAYKQMPKTSSYVKCARNPFADYV
tara:strand:- start:279 stop:599 length:321 start_codon:yes stop_codon:yes gene_type:complete